MANSVSGRAQQRRMQGDAGRFLHRTVSLAACLCQPHGVCGLQDAFAVTDPCTAGYKHACGAVTPSWKLVEQHKADLGNSWGDMGRGLRASSNAPQVGDT